MSDEEAERELILFFEVWYDHKRQPDDPALYEAYNTQLIRLTDLLEAKIGKKLTFSNIRVAYGPRFHQWIVENKLPALPSEPC